MTVTMENIIMQNNVIQHTSKAGMHFSVNIFHASCILQFYIAEEVVDAGKVLFNAPQGDI